MRATLPVCAKRAIFSESMSGNYLILPRYVSIRNPKLIALYYFMVFIVVGYLAVNLILNHTYLGTMDISQNIVVSLWGVTPTADILDEYVQGQLT